MQAIISLVRTMLQSMNDGEISASPYDTAWVSLVPAAGGGAPRFPSCLEWIAGNQLGDGSWGDAGIFSTHDRMINTLACVIALTAWRAHPHASCRGLDFVRENIRKLEAAAVAEPMPIGFEITFPWLVEMAGGLGLDVPVEDRMLKDIYAMRRLKLKKIPQEVLHRMPTTLLHSLEGLPDLNWAELLKLQCANGSFLFSPSATAYALIQTGDDKCLAYLQSVVSRFNGGVPNVYPVDLFEHLWSVDRLERLGVSRHFGVEIKACLDYVRRFWSEKGICWARDSVLPDVDDTSMAFRLLRLHGFNVAASVLGHFERDGEFFCFERQSSQAVTGMFNLHRAAQLSFPGETVLERAERFSHKFLEERVAVHALQDKWFISKDLSGEVMYALQFPWFASLPRVETRIYIDQYGGSSDVWIGKTLYRMPLVSNDLYLDLAKADFDECQLVHQLEWRNFQMCYDERALGLKPKSAVRAYFVAAASIFEPGRAPERLGWARTAVVAEAISIFLRGAGEESRRFIRACVNGGIYSYLSRNSEGPERLTTALRQLIDDLALSSAAGAPGGVRHARHCLQEAWMEWFEAWTPEKDETAVLLVRTIEICAGRLSGGGGAPEFAELARLTSSIRHRLNAGPTISSDSALQPAMQQLLQRVLAPEDGGSDGGDDDRKKTRQTFLTVAKSCCYLARCQPAQLDEHVAMVLFESVGSCCSSKQLEAISN